MHFIQLLLDDLQDLDGAGLYADAAGDALGSDVVFQHHDLHGAGFNALAALDAGVDLGLAVLFNDLNAGQGGIGYLVECCGAGVHTAQACHAAFALFNGQLFHLNRPPKYCSHTNRPHRGSFLSP